MRLSDGIELRGILRNVVIITGLIFSDIKPERIAVGMGFFLLGAMLHFWSKGVLVRNWVVTSGGPYRIVRHPFYLANFLIDMGICLFSGNLYLTALYLPAYLLTYIPTIRREETFLRDNHGEQYVNYAKTIPALVPYRFLQVFGPLDFSWDNIVREHEVSRLTRILATPFYFLIVHAAFRMPADASGRNILLVSAIVMAVGLNAGSVLFRRRQDKKSDWKNCLDL